MKCRVLDPMTAGSLNLCDIVKDSENTMAQAKQALIQDALVLQEILFQDKGQNKCFFESLLHCILYIFLLGRHIYAKKEET